MAQLESLMHDHFVDYASYFILDRAIPDIRDGLKPVQRRLLHTLFVMNDGRYHKVANVIGDTMKLHPHGDASIGDALVVLANKEYFIDRQGNFGNVITGHSSAAPRYIECRLTQLALDTMFHEPLTEFVSSYDGRTQEPVFLPTKLPVALLLGSEGIAVGMATKILPHNLPELWEAQIDLLEGRKIELYPDFQQGGLMDVSAYEDGRGKVDVRARIKTLDPKRVAITEIPYGTTTESLIASIEAAAQKGRVKVASINDFTTDKVEIELTLARGVHPAEAIPQLYAYTDCSVSVSSNLNLIRDRRPETMTVTEVLEYLTERLRVQLKAELEYDRERLLDRQHWLTLEQIFVEKKVYKPLENADTQKKVHSTVVTGMKKHESLFVRPMVDDDVKRLLEIRIRRISAYDIGKNRAEVDVVATEIKEINRKLRNMVRTTIEYVQGLIDKYAEQFPRRTHITRIETVDKKAVARQNVKLSYDRDSSFFGSAVRGDLFKMTVSEYDLILGIARDGSYRIMSPVDKVYFSDKLLYCKPFDPEAGAEFTVVYRDKKRLCFGKRIQIQRFIRNREYTLIKDKAGKVDLLLEGDQTGEVALAYPPAKRQRVKGTSFDLSKLQPTAAGARGVRLAPKPVGRISFQPSERKAGRKARAKPKSPGAKAGAAKKLAKGEQGDLFD